MRPIIPNISTVVDSLTPKSGHMYCAHAGVEAGTVVVTNRAFNACLKESHDVVCIYVYRRTFRENF
jgi:hypothetical protein